MSRTCLLLALPFALLVACTGKADEDDDGRPGTQGDDTGVATDDTGGTAGDGGAPTDQLPARPDPFTLRVTGGADLSLHFDTPTCSKPVGSSNFRAFWRDSTGSHVFVLIADLLGSFDDAGTYDTASHGAKVKLQEEAGGTGSYAYFATDDTQGDSATITVDFIDEEELEIAWGQFSFTSLHGDSGPALTAAPQPIPIWCDALN